jgi:hypothetical protein
LKRWRLSRDPAQAQPRVPILNYRSQLPLPSSTTSSTTACPSYHSRAPSTFVHRSQLRPLRASPPVTHGTPASHRHSNCYRTNLSKPAGDGSTTANQAARRHRHPLFATTALLSPPPSRGGRLRVFKLKNRGSIFSIYIIKVVQLGALRGCPRRLFLSFVRSFTVHESRSSTCTVSSRWFQIFMPLFPFLFSLLAEIAPDSSRQDPPRSAHSHSAAPLARPPMRTHSHTCPSASLTPPTSLVGSQLHFTGNDGCSC